MINCHKILSYWEMSPNLKSGENQTNSAHQSNNRDQQKTGKLESKNSQDYKFAYHVKSPVFSKATGFNIVHKTIQPCVCAILGTHILMARKHINQFEGVSICQSLVLWNSNRQAQNLTRSAMLFFDVEKWKTKNKKWVLMGLEFYSRSSDWTFPITVFGREKVRLRDTHKENLWRVEGMY